MLNKKSIMIGSAVLLMVVLSITIWALFIKEDEKKLEVEENYVHSNAVNSAVEGGYTSEKVEDIELGMSVDEVDKILGETGKVDGESGNRKKVVYSANDGYSLEIIFEDNKVIGISVVK